MVSTTEGLVFASDGLLNSEVPNEVLCQKNVDGLMF